MVSYLSLFSCCDMDNTGVFGNLFWTLNIYDGVFLPKYLMAGSR